jgi:hypothetical protein
MTKLEECEAAREGESRRCGGNFAGIRNTALRYYTTIQQRITVTRSSVQLELYTESRFRCFYAQQPNPALLRTPSA